MELHKALKNIVNLSGVSILKEQRLVNILADFNAYEDVPSAKFIIKTIIAEGYMERLIANGKWDSNCDKLIDQFAAMTGVVKDNVSYVFESLGFSLGWIVNPVIFLTQTQVSVSNNSTTSKGSGLHCSFECGNGDSLSGFVLSNPSARRLDDHKIIVACTVTGFFKKDSLSINVCCAIYKDDIIVKNIWMSTIYSINFSGFCITSEESELDTNVDEINRIVFYIC